MQAITTNEKSNALYKITSLYSFLLTLFYHNFQRIKSPRVDDFKSKEHYSTEILINSPSISFLQ